MSDIPSTEFDSEIELTTGTDTIPGIDGPDVSGDNLILGEISGAEDSGLNTLNGSDYIDGGDGTDTLRLAADGGALSIGNFDLFNTEVFEARNQADELEVNLAFAQGVETLWFNNNFGGWTWFSAVQDAADIVVTGGDADLYVDYANGVTVTTQDVLVENSDSWLGVNYESENFAIPNVNIHAQGAGNYLDLEVFGQTSWTIMGDADLEIDESGSSRLQTINANGLAGATGAVNLELDADVGGGPVTVLTQGDSFDTLELDFDGSSDGVVKTGLRGDDITINSSDNLIVKSGNGGDTIDINNADGDVLLGSGKGKDNVAVHTINGGNLTGDTGTTSNNQDTVELAVSGSVGTALDAFKTGGGDDYVYGSVGVDLTLDMGDGDNEIYTWSGRDTNITTLDGDDYAYISVGDDLVANFGAGDDDLYMFVNDNYNPIGDPFYAADINMGSGNDFVRADVNGNLKAVLGAGDDVIGIPNVDGVAHVKAGSGNDELRTGYRGISDADSFTGGNGTDTIFAKNDNGNSGINNGLEALNESGDFAQVTSTEVISILDDQEMAASQWVSFDGVNTGANDAGVRNYMFEMDDWSGDGDIESNYKLTNIASESTLDIGLDGSDLEFFELGLVSGGTSATVNLHLASDTMWDDFAVDNADELTFVALDEDNNIFDVPTVTIGGPATFTGNELTTLNLQGNAHITMQSIDSPNLDTIAGGDLAADADLTLTSVADGITVTTGVGDDTIVSNSATADNIFTGDGDDSVSSGTGIDYIDLGAGNDDAYFDATALTSADTVIGGDGLGEIDKVIINNGTGGVVGNDDFFYKWDGVEEFVLGDGDDDLQLNAIANDSGMQGIDLSTGGADTLTIGEGFMNPLTVRLYNSGGDVVIMDGSIATAPLTLDAFEAAFDGDDTFTGGMGSSDTINMQATAGDADLTGVTGFEFINVSDALFPSEAVSITTADENVGAGEILTITSSQQDTLAGGLTLDATAEADNGAFNVTGSWYKDTITTMGGDDFISTIIGDDVVDAGDGNNFVIVGANFQGFFDLDGKNMVTTGSGNDTIWGGSSSLFGDTDTISSGAGMDTINGFGGVDIIDAGDDDDTVYGGTGMDQITGGLGADTLYGEADADTFFYTTLLESSDATLDTIMDFVSGEDKVDVSAFTVASFVGNGTDALDTTGRLTGAVEAVFELQTDTLWVNLDGNTSLDGNDLRIILTGVGDTGGLAVDGTDLVLS